MNPTPARHARLTSLVGALLTAAVAACLVAFSLVAQHAAQQSPEAPAVRPVGPGSDSGAPIEVGPFADDASDEDQPDVPDPSPSAEEEIEALLALADAPPEPVPPTDDSPDRDFPDRGPQRGDPDVTRGGPDEPGRCADTRCRPDSRPTPASRPSPSSPAPDGTCGRGHEKHAERHSHGRGKGHCEHEDDTHLGRDGGSSPASPTKGGNGHANQGSPGNSGGSSKATPPGHSRSKATPPGHAQKNSPGNSGSKSKATPPGQAKKAASGSAKSKPTKSPPGQSKSKGKSKKGKGPKG